MPDDVDRHGIALKEVSSQIQEAEKHLRELKQQRAALADEARASHMTWKWIEIYCDTDSKTIRRGA